MLAVVLISGNGGWQKELLVWFVHWLSFDHVRDQSSAFAFSQEAAFFSTTHQASNQCVVIVVISDGVSKQTSSPSIIVQPRRKCGNTQCR